MKVAVKNVLDGTHLNRALGCRQQQRSRSSGTEGVFSRWSWKSDLEQKVRICIPPLNDENSSSQRIYVFKKNR